MIYDVKIIAPSGKVKKIIPAKRLLKIHWADFWEWEEAKSFQKKATGRLKKFIVFGDGGYGEQD